MMPYFGILTFVLGNFLTGLVSSAPAYHSNKTAWHGLAKQRNHNENVQHQVDELDIQVNALQTDFDELDVQMADLQSNLLPTDLIGWTVFQRRMDGTLDFYRKWNDYAEGFGNPTGEFWLGLREISRLMKLGSYELRIDMQDFDGNWRYAYYNTFYVGIEDDSFPLTTSGYIGNAGNDLQKSNVMFSTRDHDHDQIPTEDCAELYKGAWWYGYNYCHDSNLNGLYLKGKHSTFADGVNWLHFRGHYYSLKYTEMKMRLKP